jgi:hypothetical protein
VGANGFPSLAYVQRGRHPEARKSHHNRDAASTGGQCALERLRIEVPVVRIDVD